MGGRKGWKGSEVEGTGRRKRGGKEKEGGERGGVKGSGPLIFQNVVAPLTMIT